MKNKLLSLSLFSFFFIFVGTSVCLAKFFGRGSTMERHYYDANGCSHIEQYHDYYVAWIPFEVIESSEIQCP